MRDYPRLQLNIHEHAPFLPRERERGEGEEKGRG